MKNLKRRVSVFTLLTVSVLGVRAQVAQQPSPVSERKVAVILQHLERSSNRFRVSLNAALVQARIDQTRPKNDISSFESAFATAADEFRDQFSGRRAGDADVRNVLQKASVVDGFMNRNRLNRTVQNNWASVRVDLEALANALGVSGQWNRQSFPPANSNPSSSLSDGELSQPTGRLTGTFLLDPSRSDNARDKAQRAIQNVPENEKQNVYDQIITRLESPQMLAIERRGSTVTIASSLAARVTFEADRIERQGSGDDGRSNQVTVTLRGEQLVVSSNGYKENDFIVTFDPTENDRSLRVRRQIYSDRLTQPVVVDSVYDRTSDVARWNIDDDSRWIRSNQRSDSGDFILSDETVVAVLNNDLTTKQAKPGDRFTLTVREPRKYEGAVIEGIVASVEQGGQLTGRAGLTLDFNMIRLRNGETRRFTGILTSVRATDGTPINIGNEGNAQRDNRKTSVQRTGIAEGKGIGSIIGATAGTSSVYVQRKGELELPTGTELTIRAGGPR